ncbi:MAG: T9SS type A sorting domain-containing protein [Bacteroidota bacterium]
MYRFFLSVSLLLWTFLSSAQILVKSEVIATYTQIQLFGFGLPATNGIELHKLWYNTIGSDGTADVASGLVVVPDQEDVFPLLCFQHGTTSPRENVPSNDMGTFSEYFWGSSGYVVASADYIGMGESRGFHPYLHAETQASAAIDLLRATKEFCEQQQIDLNEQLFVTGYSQGGHAAMAAFKDLEEKHSDEFTVTAAAPMSGPYNLSGTMRANAVVEEEYFFPGYLIYQVRGYQEVYGDIYNELTDIFKPRYAAIIENFDNQEEFPLGELNDTLINILVEEAGASIPKFMFQEEVLEAVIANDINNRLVQVWTENDVYDWTPQAPTQIYYCEGDEQVPFENAIFTDSIMNANGATDVSALSMGAALDHFGCAFVAYPDALSFFNGFKVSSTDDLQQTTAATIIYPNPSQDVLYWYNNSLAIKEIFVLDQLGRTILQANQKENFVNISGLAQGLYFLQLWTAEGAIVKRFVKE